MRRQDKYPDTDTFHYYNANPKNRITTDCCVRAISAATGTDYNRVVLAQAIIQMETGYDQACNKGVDVLMERSGWSKMPQPRKKDGTKYTGKEFCEFQQKYLQDEYAHGKEVDDGIVISPRIVANIGGHHMVAIVDGKVWDIWNSTRGCIGNYWVKM